MEKGLISVIIPIYNVSEYLTRCIDSVLAQTYKNLEIIAVDDGSIDDSPCILKDFALKDDRVKPIFKENGGVSSARNRGIEASNGEFLYFLDSDDWIEPYTLEKLYQFSDEYDIVQAKVIEAYEDSTKKIPDGTKLTDASFFDTNEILAYYFLTQDQNYCVNKLYKQSLIKDLRFNEDFSVAEDSQFVFRALKKATSVKYLKDITYNYFIRRDSCMHKTLNDGHFATIELRDEQYNELKHNKKLFKKFIYRYSNDLLYIIHRILNDSTGKYNNRIPILRKKLLKEKKAILSSCDITLRFKLGFIALWLCPNLFYWLYSKYKEGVA